MLADGESARCSRCGNFLTTYRTNELSHVIAYTSSALILLALACSYPFMSFKSNGLESVMTLPETALRLLSNGMPTLAFLVAAFIIIIPALVVVLILGLSVALKLERHYRWLRPAGKLVYHLQNWSMVEVFFIGVLVSLVKIGHMATVIMGASFWSYAVFSLFFVLSLSSLDRVQCWRRIGALQP
ncbi:MAG: paraquat-inducible protein A [Gammaproteobacteria bacterium]|nr:paraquat-inducible protein A [Gammaproteobacteria bacterium]MBQ0838507.1 paraquat-inducible protein A [Gammaproteobacteria bacterium]